MSVLQLDILYQRGVIDAEMHQWGILYGIKWREMFAMSSGTFKYDPLCTIRGGPTNHTRDFMTIPPECQRVWDVLSKSEVTLLNKIASYNEPIPMSENNNLTAILYMVASVLDVPETRVVSTVPATVDGDGYDGLY